MRDWMIETYREWERVIVAFVAFILVVAAMTLGMFCFCCAITPTVDMTLTHTVWSSETGWIQGNCISRGYPKGVRRGGSGVTSIRCLTADGEEAIVETMSTVTTYTSPIVVDLENNEVVMVDGSLEDELHPPEEPELLTKSNAAKDSRPSPIVAERVP